MFWFPSLSLADSPITIHLFDSAYYDVAIVKEAEKEGVLNEIHSVLLSETTLPIRKWQ